MEKEQLIEKVKALAVQFWTMSLHNGTFEGHLRELIDKYDENSEKVEESSSCPSCGTDGLERHAVSYTSCKDCNHRSGKTHK